jgi:hypothetical protein
VKFRRVDDPVTRRLPSVPNAPKRFVDDAVVAKKVVVVAAVPVALPKRRKPRLALVLKRFVEEAKEEKLVVEVALVVVALRPVKFWKVDEPLARMLAKVPRTSTQRLVVEAEVAEMFVVVAAVPVELPRVMKPKLAFVEKRFVEEAKVEKMVVEVALVVVALRPVKFWKVDEPLVRMVAKVPRPVEVMFPTDAMTVAKMLVEEALVTNKFVVVALVVVAWRPVKFWKVEEPLVRMVAKVPRPVEVMLPTFKA